MSFEIKSAEVDVDAIMRMIRKRIEEKRQGLYTDEEIREIAARQKRADAVRAQHAVAAAAAENEPEDRGAYLRPGESE